MALPPGLTELKTHLEKLLALLDEPELGLFTWWEFLGDELNEIAKYAPKDK